MQVIGCRAILGITGTDSSITQDVFDVVNLQFKKVIIPHVSRATKPVLSEVITVVDEEARKKEILKLMIKYKDQNIIVISAVDNRDA